MTVFDAERLSQIQTPFYYYDTDLLRQTLGEIRRATQAWPHFHVHYAVKANANPRLLSIIREAGLGADCVSGGEIEAAIRALFPPKKIVYAGVGKADWEINLALKAGIFCLNVESLAELQVIDQLACNMNRVADVCLRINPDVGAHTHANITTGLAENKFGIAMQDMLPIIEQMQQMKGVRLIGLHFHIGSQILDMGDFEALCNRVNELQELCERHRVIIENINVGGGLGVDYSQPDRVSIPDFDTYFRTYARLLRLRPGQQVHFEPGRAVVAQCGSLITRVLYVKQGSRKQFAIVDAGMTDLIRPALYQAYHKIENISTPDAAVEAYDVVGPICESSDVFGKHVDLPRCERGQLLAIRSAGAYGEIMASQYNCRRLPGSLTSDELAL